MKRLLLAFKDVNFSKELFNIISSKYTSDIIVTGITNSSQETVSFFMKNIPEIVCTDSQTYLEICDNIYNFDPFYFIVDELDILSNIPTNTSNLSISNSFANLITQFKNTFSNSLTNKLELKLYKQFQNLNFNFKLSGTRYLFEAILFVYEHNNLYALDNMKKNIYPQVSNKYHTNVDKVKWNIEKSITYMYEFNKTNFPGLIEEYLNFELDEKPTTKDLILLLYRLL